MYVLLSTIIGYQEPFAYDKCSDGRSNEMMICCSCLFAYRKDNYISKITRVGLRAPRAN